MVTLPAASAASAAAAVAPAPVASTRAARGFDLRSQSVCFMEEFRSSGVQEFRSSGVQEFSGVQAEFEFRSSGVQEFRSSGVQEFRSSGCGGVENSKEKGCPTLWYARNPALSI